MAENRLALQSYTKAVQYIMHLMPQQDLWENLTEVVIRFFKAEWAMVVTKDEVIGKAGSQMTGFSNKKFFDIVHEVIQTGFLALEKETCPAAGEAVFLPIGNGLSTDKVLAIAHPEAIKKELMDIYLGLASLADAVSENREYRLSLETLVAKRTREYELATRKNELILKAVGEGIFGVDLEGCFTFINPAAALMLKYDENELLGRPVAKTIMSPLSGCRVLSENGAGIENERVESIFYRADGTSFFVEYVISPVMDNEERTGCVVVFRDITKRKQEEESLKAFACTDILTGVANRRTGIEILENELQQVKNGRYAVSICFLDIDGLKTVNDLYGHSEGDAYIRIITAVIKKMIRETDTLSRLGGDEFLLILPGLTIKEAQKVIERIKTELKKEIADNPKPYQPDFSYGIESLQAEEAVDVVKVLELADEKMYRNKTDKKQKI
ncbi:diguanylate cyclase [Eubacteriaceae bacterium ES3]|nr:diguanylate cyclase [Eubacteriaceae bacterium ES3]